MEFIQNNMLLIITIALFIMFAILGYIIDKSKNNNNNNNKEKEILTEVDNSNNNFAPTQDNVNLEDVIKEEIK